MVCQVGCGLGRVLWSYRLLLLVVDIVRLKPIDGVAFTAFGGDHLCFDWDAFCFEIDDALIDSLIEGIRTYLGTLKSIVGYSVSLDYDYDLVDAFSKGQVPIVYDYTPKLPAERITNTSVMTRKYLVNLAKGAN